MYWIAWRRRTSAAKAFPGDDVERSKDMIRRENRSEHRPLQAQAAVQEYGHSPSQR
jgi:hypothetical protein